MEVSGGAAKFLRFISGKLVPYIDEHYTTDTANRIILGHSLAGYFVAYAMVEDLAGEDSPFSSYIAASPSLHYNHYILMDWIKELAPSERTGGMITSYFTYGGLEDEDDSDDTSLMKNPVLVASLNQELKERRAGRLIFRTDIYSGLGHMDTPHPTFMKGLQWVTDKGN